MKALDIINSELDIANKIKLLTGEPKKVQSYIDYYKGKQEILDRQHPTDPNKNNDINKLVFNLYKKITNTAVFFLFGESPELILNNPDGNEKIFEEFKKSYRDSETGTVNQLIGIETIGYSQSAELLYKKKGGLVGYQVLSPAKEKLYPFFDEKGDMDAYIREYQINELQTDVIRAVTYYEVYTEFEMYKYKYDNSVFEEVKILDENEKEIPVLKYKTIPIVYYDIEQPLAWEVKTLLDRFNLMSSVLGDVNDYFAFPFLKLIGYPITENDEEGVQQQSPTKNIPQVIQLDSVSDSGEKINADAEFLVWSTKPESAIYELNSLVKYLLYITSTPDLSLDNLKGLSQISGVALKFLFTDAIAQSKALTNVFYKLKRRINIHKSILSESTGTDFNKLDISVKFNIPIPENVKELIDNLVNSKLAGIISTETAVENNPYVNNSVDEIEKINSESEIQTGESFNL